MAELGISRHDACGVGAPSRWWRRLAGTSGYDRLVRIVVALWFLLIAINCARDIAQSVGVIAASGLHALASAPLVSRVFLFLFLTLIARPTLPRARPPAPGERL